MATHAYDDLYSYLAAFKNSSLAEIIAYLEELGQRRFDAFIRGLAPLIPIEKIENQSALRGFVWVSRPVKTCV